MKKIFYIVLVLVLVAAAIVIRIRTLNSGERARSISEVQAEEGIPVDVSPVTRGRLEWWRTFSGTVEGIQQGSVTADIAQEVAAVLRKEGDRVKAGEPIIRLDPVSGVARYEQARANHDWSQQNLERMEGLFAEGAISEQALDDARRARDVARADYEAARTTVELEAPIDGVVTYVGATSGERVVPGQLLAAVAQIDRVRIKLRVSESDVRLLRRGQDVRVLARNSRAEPLRGQVDRVALSADPDSRLFEVELLVENTGQVLFPGTLIPADILIERRDDCVRVPLQALSSRQEPVVFALSGEGVAERRLVRIGMANGRLAEVLSGLAEGDRVAVSGQTLLSDGAKVRIHAEIPVDRNHGTD